MVETYRQVRAVSGDTALVTVLSHSFFKKRLPEESYWQAAARLRLKAGSGGKKPAVQTLAKNVRLGGPSGNCMLPPGLRAGAGGKTLVSCYRIQAKRY